MPATFFVPGWTAERYPEGRRAILAAGQEVGHHGHSHRSPVHMDEAEERRDLEAGLAALERPRREARGLPHAELGAELGRSTCSPSTASPTTRRSWTTTGRTCSRPRTGRLVELPAHWAWTTGASTCICRIRDRARARCIRRRGRSRSVAGGAGRDAPSRGLFCLTMHPFLSGRPGRVEGLRGLVEHALARRRRVRVCAEAARRAREDERFRAGRSRPRGRFDLSGVGSAPRDGAAVPADRRSRVSALRRRADVHAAAARHRPGGRRRGRLRHPVRHRRRASAPARASALRRSGRPRPCCARTTRASASTLRRALDRRLRRPAGRARATPRARTAGSRRRSRRWSRPASSRSRSAATTRSRWPSCACSPRHGPLALVQLDAHGDTWDEYFDQRYFHGTTFQRAAEEGLIDAGGIRAGGHARAALPAADLDDGARARLHGDPERGAPRARAGGVRRLVRERVGDRPVFLSFDVDFLDPAFAPGTGTPEVAGFSTAEAIAFLRVAAGDRARGRRRGRGVAAVRRPGAARRSPPRTSPGSCWRCARWRRERHRLRRRAARRPSERGRRARPRSARRALQPARGRRRAANRGGELRPRRPRAGDGRRRGGRRPGSNVARARSSPASCSTSPATIGCRRPVSTRRI